MSLNYYRSDGWVKAVQGQAIPGAQIYVCTQPANVTPPVTPPRTTPVPWQGPNPQALIYSDAGLTPIVQPIITDGFGHYNFYVLPGLYTIVVMFNGQVQQFYVDQSIGNVGSTAGTSVLFLTNGSPNFNQQVQNLVQGAGITLVTDNLGNTVISGSGGGSGPTLKTNGVTNTNQAILNMISGSSINLSADGSGGVTISSLSLSRPSLMRWALWEVNRGLSQPPCTTTNDALSASDDGVSDAFNNPTATEGFTYTVSAANQYKVLWGQPFVFPNRGTYWEGTAKLTIDVSGAASLFYIGLSDDYIAANNPDVSSNFMGFYVLKTNGGPFSNWYLLVGNGSSYSYVDTGITVVAGQRYKLSFQFDGVTVTGFINGVQSATCMVNIPASPVSLYWRLQGTGFSGTTTATLEYLYAENATP